MEWLAGGAGCLKQQDQMTMCYRENEHPFAVKEQYSEST